MNFFVLDQSNAIKIMDIKRFGLKLGVKTRQVMGMTTSPRALSLSIKNGVDLESTNGKKILKENYQSCRYEFMLIYMMN